MASLCLAVVGFIVLLILLFLGRKRISRLKQPQSAAILLLLAASIIWWPVYVASTARSFYTLAMLGSEDDGFAEQIYHSRFTSEVTKINQACRIALNSHEEPNVRFYAALRISDLLAQRDSRLIQSTLAKLDDAPMIDTEFFGGNHLTEGFYVSGHEQVHLSVREIVERRLQKLAQDNSPH